MKGKHKIEVRSGRVVFTIELERNITILRGDSATGKTTLVEMLQAYETYGRQSGVTVSCDKPCRVLSGVNWELQLNATHGVKHTGNSQIAYHRYSERSVILAPAQVTIKNRERSDFVTNLR